MNAYYDFQPEKLEKIVNNKYFYRWGIEQITVEREEGEEPATQYKCNEIVFYGQPDSDTILKAAIESIWTNEDEKKLINDYNSAKEGLLDESYIQKYLDFLNKRAEIKSIVDSDCAELGINQDMNKLILGRLANNQGGDNLRDMVVKINSNQDETLEIIEDTKNELEGSIDDLDTKFTNKTNELEEGKVDKVSGKGLSSNDYTNSDKELLQTLASKVSSLEERVAALESQP